MERSKRRTEEARNNLESYLYKLRDLLSDESETPFTKCSQPGERSAIQKKLEETLVWMHDEADDADTTQFLEKLSSLEYVIFVIFGSTVDSPSGYDVQESRGSNCSQVQGNRGVPQSTQRFPNVELVFTTVHYRGETKPYRRG